ncbi:MAG: FecR domain-containing protein [Chlorobi bacterium]|nr:FecR domain-containing protein [Chlorobiota bacterium]
MKNKIFISFILLFSFLSFAGTVWTPKPESSIAMISKIIKEVNYRSADVKNWEKAKLGTPLGNGDGVKTGKRSIAVVEFLDGSLLRVRPETEIEIFGEPKDGKQNKETEIKSGVVQFDITQQKDEEFKFTTPTGLASIRGTSGFFKVNDDETILVVEKGIIDVFGKGGLKEKGTVEAGKTAFITSNGSVKIQKTPDNLLNELKNVKKTKTVKYKIETDDGEYEIEVLEKAD